MMKFLRSLSVAFVTAWLITCVVPDASAQSPAVVNGKVLVKFSPQQEPVLQKMKMGRKNGYIQTGMQSFDALAFSSQATEMKRVFPHNAKKDALHRKHGLHLWYELTIPANKDVNAVVKSFKNLSTISWAEPVYAKAMIQPGTPKVISKDQVKSISGPVNDPFYYLQWHYENDGTKGGIVEADVNLPEAWKIETGKPSVIVSVHDLGIDVKHEDLVTNMWVNIAEKNGRPGVDDDYNGYVDDVNGYDFSDDQGAVPAGDHGTHVGGTIAAVTNNGIGVSGIAGGDGTHPGVKLITAKILNGRYDNIAASFVYAADNGAVISQNSWGYTSPNVVNQAVLAGIDYFIEEAGNYPNSPMKGGIVIFAAGNSASSEDYYPARYDRVLTVASLGRDNLRAYYSNYGEWVDIAAPGGDQWTASDNGVLSTLPGNQYGFFQGTSMACPHVSGIAALIVSRNGGPTYTPNDLWTALTTGTHDIDQYNPEFKGLLGIGYVDAALALETNEKIAPVKVADLTIADITQDHFGLTWTAVTDTDDGRAVKYEIVYAKDESSITSRKNVITKVINASAAPGEVVQASIDDLFPVTKYYVAVYALDRWNNKSAISSIVSATTADGPHVAVDKSAINFSIDVASSKLATDGFNIQNNAAGELRWKSEVRQKDYSLAWNNVKYPKATAKVASGKVGIHRSNARIQRKPKTTTLGYHDGYEERAIRYVFSEYWGGYMIGDMDTSIPNSSATRYKVDYADGFNLTNINMLLNNNPERGDDPFVVEIYRGERIERKNLAYVQSYEGNTNYDAIYDIQLDHQIFFASGETFWVIVHMPAGHLYPLGINEETEPEYSENCFMSFDVGKTWLPVAEAVGYDFYAWVQVPISRSPGIDKYLTLSPAEGTVEGQSSSAVEVSADGTHLINGEYNADVVIVNNDFNNSLASIPVGVSVTGQKAVLQSAAIIDFGKVFTGLSKEVVIDVKNIGYGNFMVSNATVDHAAFEILESPWKIAALGQSSIRVKYNATAAESITGVVTLEDDKGNVYKINLAASGILPSEITLAPATATFTVPTLGATKTGKFKITNAGNYPLQFFMPKYDNGDGVAYDADKLNKFGYTYRNSNDGSGLAYTWEDISGTGTEIGTFFKDVISNRFYLVKLGFDFPIFNKTTDQLMITRYGMLTLNDDVNLVGNAIDIGSEYMPFGFISALNQTMSLEGGGKIYYQAKSGKFIVQYQNVASAFDENQRYTFQVIIYDNGNVLINYKDLSTIDSWGMEYIEVAIEDPDKKDGYLISNYQKPLNASSTFSVEITSPGRNILSDLSTVSGTLAVGASVDVNYTVNTAELAEGTFEQNLMIVSNDPAHPASTFKARVTVTGGGAADATINTNSINLGELFVGETEEATVQIQNTGTKTIKVNSIAFDNNRFQKTHDATPFNMKPGSSAYIKVRLKGVTPGSLSDSLRVTLTGATVKAVGVQAVVFNPPAITIENNPINDILAAGESKIHNIEIKNNGASELQVVPTGPSWAYVTNETGPSSPGIQQPKYDYVWSKSTSSGGPAYQWEEIMSKQTKLEFDLIGQHEEKVIDLPFNFTFYGKEYNKIYVNPRGLVVFSPDQTTEFFTSPSIPDVAKPNNFIAPFWTNGAYYSLDNDIYGVYAKTFEDRVVIEFVYVYNVFGMGDPWNYEVILYKNGSIKYQYQVEGGFSYTTSGVIGVENETGEEGVRIAAYQQLIENKLAIVLTPANRIDVPAGESRNLSLKVDAANMIAGAYDGNLTLHTNVPGKTLMDIPLALTVIGEAVIAAPASLNFGEIVAHEVEASTATFSQEFELSNSGAATLDIMSMKLESGEDFTLWMEVSGFFGKYWDVVPAELSLSLAPKAAQKFKVEIAPAVGMNEVLRDEIVIKSNDADGDYSISVEATIVLPAVMGIDKMSVSFQAPDKNFVGTDVIKIDNTAGQSTLKYTLSVAYQREGLSASSYLPKNVSGGNPSKLRAMASSPSTATGVLGVAGYNRTLAYSDANEADSYLGFGAGAAFVGATKFTVPNDGFTLSDIQTYYASGNLDVSSIKAEVYIGNTFSSSSLLASKTFGINVAKETQTAQILQLDKPLHFFPGETFYVVLSYPFGTYSPQGTVVTEEPIRGTFLYYVADAGVWFDLTDDPSFKKAGWFVKALEKNFVDGNWLVLNDAANGVIEAGASSNLTLTAKAVNMDGADAHAVITVASNAIGEPMKTIAANLHLNQAPQFVNGYDSYWVDENETLTFTVPVVDAEGDEISYAVNDAPEGMTWEKNSDGIAFAYTPDFLSAGVVNLSIVAKDAGQRSNTKLIALAVYNVNRTPVVVSTDDIEVAYGATLDIATSSIITDADSDDILSVSAVAADQSVVEIFASMNKLRFKALTPGETNVTITVTDQNGATASVTVKVIIKMVTEIETPIFGGVKVYPVPTADRLNVSVSRIPSSGAEAKIVDLAGKLISITKVNQELTTIDVSSLAPGLYLMKLEGADGAHTIKFIKH
ncbi:S8 family serine peptidase [Pseudochryseolinea flava]|uniref:Fibronectin type-III domain-containing protein n=1 Tax=Pseudochryseolinea flava TaxID=2059302 RepID=A0A364Y3F5_9BACT|nr:S8 family serine peptidase [Pseudochryseolinea flava]RAW01259.1 hypothetical protein DQQ10_10125 [Pseudochryseolinea flava]